MPGRPGLVSLDAIGPSGAFHARNRCPVTDVTGREVAELSLVPALFVSRALGALRRAAPPPPGERAAMLGRAARLFATGAPGGQPAADYQYAVSRVGGIPLPAVAAATQAIADRLGETPRSVALARPAGAVTWLDHPLAQAGRVVWSRRGNVFAVLAAGNHPGAHSIWPEALALGYRVAVRPSRREPFTPHRLITALAESGLAGQLALLPTGHEQATALLDGADLGMVYGGDDVTRKYAGHSRVLPQGPGRSKILLTADVDWRGHLDMIVASVSQHGGTGCVNATAVFVEGDPAPLCAALAERLAALPSLPPEDDKAVLPVQPAARARALAKYLAAQAAGTRPWLGAGDVVGDLGDGSAALRPAVHQLSQPGAPQAGIELPFPCVWVAPWTREAGLAPLRGSLVLTAVTGDRELAGQLLDEPTISNLYLGDTPTYRIDPGLPHDGYLAEFLMRSKAVIHGR